MPQVPDVSAIVDQVKARIKHIEGELARNERLSDELERLRDALSRLEGAARSRVTGRRRGQAPRATAARAQPAASTRAAPAKPASAKAPTRAPRGQNKAKVLEALKGGPMTATEIAKGTGISTGTVSTLLTKLTKTGEVAKAERGYKLPG
jgi:predicted Rossmann fold nucleotide-binding protein DprA/Smf involved in DNA uptake